MNRCADSGQGTCALAWFVVLSIALAAALSPVLAAPSPALALPPHVADGPGTDACAICHRGHTPNTALGYRTFGFESRIGNSLLLSAEPSSGDVSLCYTCHGVGALGSSVDVESSMALVSRHSVAPSSSAWGPTPKMCGDCHDSHGQDRTASGTPFPALLRVWEDSETLVFAGETYCAACHDDHVAGAWAGLTVFKDTAHYRAMPAPASGTGVRCSNCHAPHGSETTPLITPVLEPPAALLATTVPANDRRLCQGCHTEPLATWSGPETYSASSHALTPVTTTITAEWAATSAVRPVGECQNCHDPMGADGGGTALPEMLVRRARALCDHCHDSDGPASADLASLAYPGAEAASPELLVAYAPSAETSVFGRVQAYSRALTGADPRGLIGPREYVPAGAAGAASAGDLDLNGQAELVVADRSAPRVTVFSRDQLRGLTRSSGPGVAALPCGMPADRLIVADVSSAGGDAPGRPEIVVVNAMVGSLWVYRLSGSELATFAGPMAVGTDPTGIAAGDVTGTALADVVVTSAGSDEMYILTEAAGTMASTAVPTGLDPAGPSVGDAWERAGQPDEIVLVNRGEATATVSVFDGAGQRLAAFTADTGTVTGALPSASAIGDVLPWSGGSTGREIAVSLASTATGDSVINVFRQLSSGGPGWVSTATVVSAGARRSTGSLLIGDIELDGVRELVAGNGGVWSRTAAGGAPSVRVFRSDGSPDGLTAGPTYTGGGVEQAGAAPSLVMTEFGAVVPSRHPVDVNGSHVSTESAPFAHHVTCADCHDSHEATSAPASAPDVQGVLRGARGVAVTNVSTSSVTYSAPARADSEYEVCLKCHSGYLTLDGRRDISLEVNALNPSVHAVEQASGSASATAGSFVGAWTKGSILYCVDCHSNASGTEPAGPHRSIDAPVLRAPYTGTTPADSTMLCYDCHRYDVYFTGAADTTPTGTNSLFYHALRSGTKMHRLHVNDNGFGCVACHRSHGSGTQPHLQLDDRMYEHRSDGGACSTPCHAGGARRSYSRAAGVSVPATVGVTIAASFSGDATSLITQDGSCVIVGEVIGVAPAFSVEVTFTGVPSWTATPTFEMFGRYQGNPAHVVRVQAYNSVDASWNNLGVMPSSAGTATYTYAFTDPDQVSGSGTVWIRLLHESIGAANHWLYLDTAWFKP